MIMTSETIKIMTSEELKSVRLIGVAYSYIKGYFFESVPLREDVEEGFPVICSVDESLYSWEQIYYKIEVHSTDPSVCERKSYYSTDLRSNLKSWGERKDGELFGFYKEVPLSAKTIDELIGKLLLIKIPVRENQETVEMVCRIERTGLLTGILGDKYQIVSESGVKKERMKIGEKFINDLLQSDYENKEQSENIVNFKMSEMVKLQVGTEDQNSEDWFHWQCRLTSEKKYN